MAILISSYSPDPIADVEYIAAGLRGLTFDRNALSRQADCVMRDDRFHQSFTADAVKPPSERATGLVFATVALIVALLWRNEPTVLRWALGIAAALATVSLIAPRFLKPLNLLWFKFGLLLHKIVNPVVMLAIFALIFVPAGAIMRIWHDPLRARRKPEASTYWIDRKTSGHAAGSMTNQF